MFQANLPGAGRNCFWQVTRQTKLFFSFVPEDLRAAGGRGWE